MMEKRATKANSYMVLLMLSLSLTFAGATPVRLQAQDAQEKLSPQQLEELIGKAKTTVDHEKLASYYRQEAARLRQDAKAHRVDANIYAKGQGLLHCTNLAKLDEQAAKEDDALAGMHEGMAKATPK